MIDPDRMTITTAGRVLRPPRMVFLLCQYLAANPGFVRSRAQIMDAVGISCGNYDRAVDSLVRRARAIDGLRPHIKTHAGAGYYWEA